jgi:hypothetical protein
VAQFRELEKREAALIAELASVREEMLKIRRAACPIKPGMVVRYRQKEYRVAEIAHPEWGWVVGNPRLRNGKFGTARRRLLDGCEIVQG